jgi:hypothetical protein
LRARRAALESNTSIFYGSGSTVRGARRAPRGKNRDAFVASESKSVRFLDFAARHIKICDQN